MINENEFNISSNNNFKKSKFQHSNGFGKNFIIPFISGILGASLVMGTCFCVPSIRTKIITGSTTPTSITPSISTSTNLINLSNYSDTSISVAEKVLPSVVGIKVTYQVNSIFGSSSGEATGSGIIISEVGYIVTAIPDMDAIAINLPMANAHTTNELIYIDQVQDFWTLFQAVLAER